MFFRLFFSARLRRADGFNRNEAILHAKMKTLFLNDDFLWQVLLIKEVSKHDEFCSQNEECCIKYQDFCVKTLELCSKNEKMCIKNEELCIKNEEFCSKNE